MTLEEARAIAAAKLDEVFEARLLDFEGVLRLHGSTESEINEELAVQRALFAHTRATVLAEVVERLCHDGQRVN